MGNQYFRTVSTLKENLFAGTGLCLRVDSLLHPSRLGQRAIGLDQLPGKG
jgi:hypothetical protein